MDESTNKLETQLKEGKSYSTRELLEYMIIDSDNEATILLLDFIGEDYVHQVERDLGYLMPDNVVFFQDIITVRQYSAFFRVLFNSSYLNREYSNMALELMSRSHYRSGIRRSVPEGVRISHKYGRNAVPISDHEVVTNQLHHFGIVYLNETPYLLGIMTRGDDERVMEQRIHDISSIVFSEMSLLSNSPQMQLNRDTD